ACLKLGLGIWNLVLGTWFLESLISSPILAQKCYTWGRNIPSFHRETWIQSKSELAAIRGQRHGLNIGVRFVLHDDHGAVAVEVPQFHVSIQTSGHDLSAIGRGAHA